MLVSSERRLFSDMTVRCADPQSLQWILGVGVPMLAVFVVGVPLVLLVILRRNFSEGECSKESRLTYGFLFAECTSGCRGCMSWVRLDMCASGCLPPCGAQIDRRSICGNCG